MKKTTLGLAVFALGILGLATTAHAAPTSAPASPRNMASDIIVAQSGNYLVIAGSFSIYNGGGDAQQRLSYVHGCGFSQAYIVNTDNYPNLRNGLYAVVVGPLSYGAAQNMTNAMRGCVGDAYSKSGW